MKVCGKKDIHVPECDDCQDPTSEIDITENGTYDVSDYSQANVEIICEELPSANGIEF